MSSFVGVVVSDQWLQSQFTQVELRGLNSNFLSARNQSGKVTLGDLPPVLCKLKAFQGILIEDDIKEILSESSSDMSEEIDFESFLRVSAYLQARATAKGDSKTSSSFLKATTTTLRHTISESERGSYPHLVFGLIAQIIKIQLLADLNLRKAPQLVELVEDSQDGEAYAHLLNTLAPEHGTTNTLDTEDPTERANLILEQAENLDCKRYVTPKDIVEGSANLNLAFVAQIFQHRNGLTADTTKLSFAVMMEDDAQTSREERCFRLWINSLGTDTYVNNLFEDVRTGWVLLEVLDKISEGLVNWKQANCNQVISIGKELNFSLVNVAGSDIVQGNKKLILAFLWQLMRFSMLQLLINLKFHALGKEITDDKKLNATYTISVARKLECSIFLLPKDIIEVNQKMMLTLTASIMYWSLQTKTEDSESNTAENAGSDASPAAASDGDIASTTSEVEKGVQEERI
ncbi:hypothetical protein R3W88_032358 [Solanum pinnatisectum]|uniref:Calponin-homology (CH) domain-containing protein n=1 Tax=Solanum pinnatisectum TaxID=50273 RepID=A0AAV9LNY9_9SOLN|nr:hypothetical protein R3W88_032358 [Solanum pinnatisectum]